MAQHGHGFIYGCGSKTRYQNGTLVSGNMDQNPRFAPAIVYFFSHIHMDLFNQPLSIMCCDSAGFGA